MNNRIADANNFLEINGLSELKRKATSGDEQQEKEALHQVAKQFESIFMQMMLKSMRQANDVLSSDSPFNTQSTKFYRDMHDQQMALELSSNGSLGLSEMIVRQLGGGEDYTPASLVRSNGNLDSPRQISMSNLVEINEKESMSKTRHPQADKTMPGASEFKTPEQFVKTLVPYAQKVEQALGVPKEVFIAQSALETGWGQKIIRKQNGDSSHNLFNIKADKRWAGEHASKETLEFEQGAMVRKKEPFRVYDSISESISDYINFLSSSDRYQGLINKNLNMDQFLQGLQQSGYATDPNYANKIVSVMGKVVELIK
jgi:flagellar protein FlgJ